ncbi:MAG: AAA family ATPase [Treponema sp.]|jgi:chromosome partitioning protein|nr:AAA family ATPase [Treponema sp.]
MERVFVFVNQKGGVGKTTSAVNLGAYLAETGKSVLLVDFDSQANLSSGVGLANVKPGAYELISGQAALEEVIRKTQVPNLDVIPSHIDLSGAAIELVDQEKRDFFLKQALEPARNRYDYILIDCPPSLGVLTLNGLAAADSVLIPMQCEYFAMEGLSLLLRTIKRIQKNLNPRLKIGGIFFTMYDQRTRLAQDVVKEVSAYFKDTVFTTIIPRNVRISEAPSYGLPISRYDPESSGARAYKSLTDEMLRRIDDGDAAEYSAGETGPQENSAEGIFVHG